MILEISRFCDNLTGDGRGATSCVDEGRSPFLNRPFVAVLAKELIMKWRANGSAAVALMMHLAGTAVCAGGPREVGGTGIISKVTQLGVK